MTPLDRQTISVLNSLERRVKKWEPVFRMRSTVALLHRRGHETRFRGAKDKDDQLLCSPNLI